ncbi:transcriptional regulator, partial [Acidianus sp. RZ1]|uniref:transcriptional regulator n=1 Tax=Acidianus sp. RZ1 TaxID=1540082 RepID=UPI001493205C
MTESKKDPNEVLRLLMAINNDPALKSSTRLMILIALAINKKISYKTLLEITRLKKGSLSNHLAQLEEAGYITVRNSFSLGSPRIV